MSYTCIIGHILVYYVIYLYTMFYTCILLYTCIICRHALRRERGAIPGVAPKSPPPPGAIPARVWANSPDELLTQTRL